MVNSVWFFLIVLGVTVGVVTHRSEVLTKNLISAAEGAVTLTISLVGMLAMWSGVMKIAEEAGLIRALSRLVRPFIRLLFPSIPRGHPAGAAIVMSILANILGMGNAATPLGLKAMQALQELNPRKDEASDAMCTFLAIAVSGFTLIPTTVLVLRAQAGSKSPADTVVPSILVSILATFVALIIDRLFQRSPTFWISGRIRTRRR